MKPVTLLMHKLENHRKAIKPALETAMLLWVTCGRRLGKSFLTFLQLWSGAVTGPAC